MANPIIHFPMEADELLLMIETAGREIDELKSSESFERKARRQALLLLKIRLSATYKELTGLTQSAN